MMTWVVMLGAIVAAGVLQTELPGFAWLGQAKPPVLLAIVLYYALQRTRPVMATAAVAAGLMQDALSPLPLGASAGGFLLAGWYVSRFRKVVLTESVLTQGFFGLVTGMAVTLVLYVMLVLESRIGIPVGRLILKTLGNGILGMLVAPPVCWLLNRLDRMVGNIVLGAEVEEAIDEFEEATG
ncbi:MAG: rod shape-determining protein MreD [Candidatus Brocadiia bacterium]|jgi:rod shape-determining protein MreD|nr:rod shape-determining protein MreD [Candidatus Brocadiia bacterium]